MQPEATVRKNIKNTSPRRWFRPFFSLAFDWGGVYIPTPHFSLIFPLYNFRLNCPWLGKGGQWMGDLFWLTIWRVLYDGGTIKTEEIKWAVRVYASTEKRGSLLKCVPRNWSVGSAYFRVFLRTTRRPSLILHPPGIDAPYFPYSFRMESSTFINFTRRYKKKFRWLVN